MKKKVYLLWEINFDIPDRLVEIFNNQYDADRALEYMYQNQKSNSTAITFLVQCHTPTTFSAWVNSLGG